MYIMWGPPDEIESHPTGGTYDRPMEEGGGSTTTYPWETWRYRYMEGIGENVIWEFVDPIGFRRIPPDHGPRRKRRVAARARRRLELARRNGHGFQDGSLHAVRRHEPADRAGRHARRAWTNSIAWSSTAKAFKPPEVKYKDLEAIVTARIVRDQMKFTWRTDFVKVTNDTVLVPVTVQVPNNQLSFDSKDGVHSATLNVFGRVSSLTGRVVQTFEDPVSRDFPGQPVSAIGEAAVDLSEGRSAAPGSLSAGHRDQGRTRAATWAWSTRACRCRALKTTSWNPAR